VIQMGASRGIGASRGGPRSRRWLVKTVMTGALLTAVPSAALTLGTTAAGASTPGATAPRTTALKAQSVSSRPAIPKGAQVLGRLASSATIAGDIALKPRNASGLKAYASEVGTPGSAHYHQYLTLRAFDATFAPSSSTVASVKGVLRSGGLRVTSVSADGLIVSFKGSASAVAGTFHTAFESYRFSGRRVFANTSAADLPASIAGKVQAVVGLNDLFVPQAEPPSRFAKSGTKKESPDTTPPAGAAKACAAANSTAAQDSGLTSNQVAYAYGLDPLYSSGDFGGGQKIDILDLFGYSSSDFKTFEDCYFGTTRGAKVLANISDTAVDGGAQAGEGGGGSVETELDVESATSYAPAAQVDVFEAPNSDPGFLDDIAAMTDDTASKVESISYGECEATLLATEPGYAQIENSLFEQAAAEGKTVFSSSADDGSDTCSNDSGLPVAPILSASDPASQPYVTGVGGTAITAATDPPSEDVWNDGSAGGAGGGGISELWQEPAWQAATQVPGMNNGTVIAAADNLVGNDFCQATYTAPCREIPDISAQASPNTGGFPVVLGGQWTVYGGTSLASPTWAAILADINSTPSCVAGGGVGFVSPALYAIASVPSEYAASFDDITVGNNDNLGASDGLFPATTGYDMASGLGAPKVTGAGGANGLAYYLCASAAAAAPKVTSISPTAITTAAVSSGTSLTVHGSGFEANGSSDVADVTIGNFPVSGSAISVSSSSELVVHPVPAAALQNGNGGVGDGSGTYDVSVTVNGGGTSAPGPDSRLVIYDNGHPSGTSTPVVDGTEPTGGVESGGSTVTIYGSGFAEEPVNSVTFGGVAAASFHVVNDGEISAVTPAYQSGTTGCGSSDNPATGVCQVQVQVTNAYDSSVDSTIPPEFSGYNGDATSSAGIYPAATEFDYEPAPHISSIGFVSPSNSAASEAGGTEVSINGTGLGILGSNWINVGSYKQNTAENFPIYYSSTQDILVLPAKATTSSPRLVPLTVQTLGSPNQAPGQTLTGTPPSNQIDVPYAPTPSVTGLRTGGTYMAGPTSGGTALTITGSGFDFADQVVFVDLKYGFESNQDSLTVDSNTKITVDTPAALTGVDAIEVCGLSGCSAASTATFTFYLPGNPSVTSVTPTTGPAGTKVVIKGDNLGYITAVYFGSTPATIFKNGSAFFESGNTYKVIATAPTGTAGTTVDIQVETLESQATGYGKSPVNTNATFTYSS